MRLPVQETAEESQNDPAPVGVHLIALIAGVILIVLGWKSLTDDYRLLHKLTHLDEVYRPMPSKMLQVASRRDSLESGDKYYPDVLFEYFVDGKSIWGWRFSYEEEPRRKAYWERRLASYHPGDTVTAYVDPANPKDSFIEKKTDSLIRPLLKALLAGVFVLFGGLLFAIPAMTFSGKLLGKKSRTKLK